MLDDYIEQAVRAGGDALEIEYRDGKEYFTAFSGPFGIGLGCLTSGEAEPILGELALLKKSRHIIVDGKKCRLRFTKHESFGEWVNRIEIIRDRK